jgi:hypothetical protein
MSQTLAQLIQGLSVNSSAPAGSFTVDSLGRVLVGASTARSNFFGTTLSARAQVEGTGGAVGRGAVSVINNDVSNNPPYVLLGRSGAASFGSNAVVVSGSRLGTLTFHGADGTSFIEAATVAGEVDGTPGSNDMPGRLVFSTTADGAASPTERLRIDSSGRVGIGTSSPGGILEVKSADQNPNLYRLYNAYNAGASSWGVDFYRDTDSGNNLSVAEIKAVRTGGNTSELKFGTSSTPGTVVERVRIDSSGRLLVGTSTAVSSEQFNVTGSVGNYITRINNSNASPSGLLINYTGASPNGTSNEFLLCFDNASGGTTRASIRSNGGIANYSANNVNLSDRNAKKDISLAVGTWDCLKEWEIVNFRYKDQPEDADLNMGVIAQQVAESCPEVITVFQEATEDQPEKLGVKDQQMMWMAIKALQEAQVRIEQLESKVVALEGA